MRNFETVLMLLGEAEVTEQEQPSQLDLRMGQLEKTSPLGSAHPAVKQYNKCMRGAGDTVRSIIISANSRLAFLENKQVLRLLSRDDLNLAELGTGVDGDGKTRTALFCVIPDSDKSYNFIIGMLYTQIFQELYYQADFHCGGRLPVHVTFMLDEFANVALPDDYCSLLSTMRSREISSIIIIQNFAQLKALFKDTWETVPGNCDTFIYLGGNEQSTHKYVSELLGKGTIDKKSSGETKGRQGSSSRNYDVLGRELYDKTACRHGENTSDAIKAVVKKAKVHRKKPEGGDSLMNRMAQWHYSEEQKAELHKMTALGIPKETILAVFYPETDVEILRELQKTYQVAQNTVS